MAYKVKPGHKCTYHVKGFWEGTCCILCEEPVGNKKIRKSRSVKGLYVEW